MAPKIFTLSCFPNVFCNLITFLSFSHQQTAYFVISEDAKHGEDLVCSYFACRNGGVKFRYCAHCMAPVAKRNFCRRHDHGMSKVDGETNGEDDEVSLDQSEGSAPKDSEGVAKPCKESNKESSPEKALKKKEAKESAQASMNLLTSTATNKFLDSNKKKRKKTTDEIKTNEDGKDSSEDMEVEVPNESTSGIPLEGEGSRGLASISSKRRKLWTELLVRRPRTKDPRHLSAWLNEVLTVSEFEIPLDQIELPPAPATDSVGGSGESDVEKKEKKSEEPKTKKHKTSSDEESSSKPENEEKKISDDDKKTESSELSSKKSSPKKEAEDGFAGSFADWRDRKKEKAMSKKGTGSLRK